MMRISISPLSPNPIPTIKTIICHYSPFPNPSSLLNPKPRNIALHGLFNPKNGVQCKSTGRTPGPGENDNRIVLDAFFLGKAFAEALNEQIGSTVGEISSVVGQWQADQQKQVEDFQISAAAACDNIILWAAIYGSISEFPKEQFPYGSEQ